MALNDSVMPMGPPRSQKRQRKPSPVTPLKRRRIQPSPSTASQGTPASTQISSSYTSTPLTGPRTREQLDRYYENVKRDAGRIRTVEYQLQILRQDGQDSQDVDAEPDSSPEPSESAPIPTKQAVRLLEKILMDHRAIERLEEERKEIEVKKRGPSRANTDGVIKRTHDKQQTRRAKIRKEIRNIRKRIGYAWSKLKAAGMVTEPETLTETAASTAADMASPRMSSPIISKTVAAQPDGDSGAIADESDSEPSLPTACRTIARSAMSPSVPPVPAETENGSHPTGDIGNANTDASADREPVKEQAAPEIKSISKSLRVPRRSIYTPDSADEENHFGLNGREEISAHTATATSAPIPRGSASAIAKNSINTNNEKTQGKPATPHFPDDMTHSSDGEDSSDDRDTHSEDDFEDESIDVEVKLEPGEDDVKVKGIKNHDVESKAEVKDGEDDEGGDESDSDDDEAEDEKEEDEKEEDEKEEDEKEEDEKEEDEKEEDEKEEDEKEEDEKEEDEKEEDEKEEEEDDDDDEEEDDNEEEEDDNEEEEEDDNEEEEDDNEEEEDDNEEEEEDDETDDESSDVEVKSEMEDEAVALQLFKESSDDTRDGKDKGDGAAEDQNKESGESQHIVQPNGPEAPTSSRPSTGLFERMNGIQTSGSFEAMMADLRRAAAERERQARLAGQVVDSETSDSSDDDSLPYFSPEPEAKPYNG